MTKERQIALIDVREEGGKQTVSARELHENLEVATQFKDWIKRMIDYGFQEGVDYAVLKNERGENGEL